MKDSRQNAEGSALEMKILLNCLGFNYLWDNEKCFEYANQESNKNDFVQNFAIRIN